MYELGREVVDMKYLVVKPAIVANWLRDQRLGLGGSEIIGLKSGMKLKNTITPGAIGCLSLYTK